MKQDKPIRRIVSKREYVTNIGRKVIASAFSIGLLLLSLIFVLSVGIILGSLNSIVQFDPPIAVCLAFIVLPFTSGAFYACKLGMRTLKHTRQIDTGVPLTRANAASVTVARSLVRGSQQPEQTQRDILLRAVADPQDTPVEQLLRPTQGV